MFTSFLFISLFLIAQKLHIEKLASIKKLPLNTFLGLADLCKLIFYNFYYLKRGHMCKIIKIKCGSLNTKKKKNNIFMSGSCKDF